MPVPNKGRARSALGHYNLRQNMVPPRRYLVDYSGPVNPSRTRRILAGMATEGLALDHSSNSFRSSSEAGITWTCIHRSRVSSCGRAERYTSTGTKVKTIATIAVRGPRAVSCGRAHRLISTSSNDIAILARIFQYRGQRN